MYKNIPCPGLLAEDAAKTELPTPFRRKGPGVLTFISDGVHRHYM